MKNGYCLVDGKTIISRHISMSTAIKAFEKRTHFLVVLKKLENGKVVELTEADVSEWEAVQE